MERHNIFKRMEKLCKVKKSTTKSNDLAEAIDRDMTRLMLHSEKQFQKRSPTPFSSTLAQACLSVSILKLLQLSQKHGTDKKVAIASLQSKCTKKVPLPESLPATKSALKLARKEVKRIRKHALEIRDQHLLDSLSNCEDPKILKRIKRAEELSRSYQKIAHILNPSNAALVTQVEIPADGLPPKQAIKWNRITDPNQVTEIIFNRNTKHFQGAHGTPFTTEPLATVYDWSATTPAHAATLEGSPPEHENELVQLILNHSKRKIRSFQATITLEELIKRLRKWSEKTSTSPSCRHLGHYKSLLPGAGCDMDEYKLSKACMILEVHLDLLNYCAKTGYSLHRWQTIVTTTIPKEAGNFKIHRLRVIHLYEADLTALFSIWSRRMIVNSEKKKTINEGSFGARPGRTSQDPAYLQTLQIETALLSRTKLANCPNDATQCYDRIIPNHAMLSAASHGMPSSAATCIGSTLQHARYHLRTALSQTKEYWTNKPGSPVYGTGQGSAISPSLCCVTYSDAMDVHASISHGAKYVCPFDDISTTINNIGFVDDTNTTTCDLVSELSPDVLQEHLRASVQNWNDLLIVLGGAIEFSKTEVYLLDWKFDSQGYAIPYCDATRTLSFQRSSGDTMSVPISSLSEPFKTLGYHLSMTQDNSKQFDVVKKRSHEIANAICGSSCNRREAFVTYFAVYNPSLAYVLPLTTFTKQQCKVISTKPTQLFLQKCGFVSTTARAIVYASRKSGGLGFRHLYTEQGIAHLVKLFQALRTPSQACQLTRIAIRWWHSHAGTGYDLLMYPYRSCLHLEGTWLTSTRDFLQSIHGRVESSFRSHSLPFRDGD